MKRNIITRQRKDDLIKDIQVGKVGTQHDKNDGKSGRGRFWNPKYADYAKGKKKVKFPFKMSRNNFYFRQKMYLSKGNNLLCRDESEGR